MPPKSVNERMIILEGAFEGSMSNSDIFIYVYSRTGNNLKNWFIVQPNKKNLSKCSMVH
jgi:hypothetical protein